MSKLVLNILALGMLAAISVALQADDAIDPRLAQKITYDSGCRRLHDVADDLSKMSGVNILSGQSIKDWRVRDIPVVIYVKDMPLGKLLQAIADATHTRFASEKIGKDAQRSYRIYRNYADEMKIEDYFRLREEASTAETAWQWDAMVAYGKSSEFADLPKSTWLIARLIASLGPDARAKMLDGVAFRFSGKDPASQEIVQELYRCAWEETKRSFGEDADPVPLPTQQELENCVVSIKGTAVDLSPMKWGQNPSSNWCCRLDCASRLQAKGLVFSARPKAPVSPTDEEDMGNPAMTLLRTENDWDRPVLKVKVDVEKPKDIKEPTFADVIRTVASASGINIVTEDFGSQMAAEYQQTDSAFKKNTTVADSLRSMNSVPNVRDGYIGHTWFVSEQDKLLVGWSRGAFRQDWRKCHKALLSEAYLNKLKSKLAGDGLTLDDYVGAQCLADTPTGVILDDPFGTWIYRSRDFVCLKDIPHCSGSALWRLYSALTPSDKALARSKDGVSLSKFDTAWIADFFRVQRKKQGAMAYREYPMSEEVSLDERVMSDPKVIATMTMHIQSRPANSLGNMPLPAGIAYSDVAAIAGELGLECYDLAVTYKLDGRIESLTVQGLERPLPIWSSERGAELIEAADKKIKGAARAAKPST